MCPSPSIFSVYHCFCTGNVTCQWLWLVKLAQFRCPLLVVGELLAGVGELLVGVGELLVGVGELLDRWANKLWAATR